MSIGALSWLGHLPDPTRAPPAIVERIAATVGVDAAALADYATVGVRVRQVDAAEVVAHAGWRRPSNVRSTPSPCSSCNS